MGVAISGFMARQPFSSFEILECQTFGEKLWNWVDKREEIPAWFLRYFTLIEIALRLPALFVRSSFGFHYFNTKIRQFSFVFHL